MLLLCAVYEKQWINTNLIEHFLSSLYSRYIFVKLQRQVWSCDVGQKYFLGFFFFFYKEK